MALVKLISCHIRVFKNDSQISRRKFVQFFFTISVCVQSKTRETNIFIYLSQYLTNLMHKLLFYNRFNSCLYMFRAHVLIIGR